MTPEAAEVGRAAPFGRFERTLAWRYLRSKREHGGAALVSIISVVGIALAVWALVVVMSVMNGFRSEMVESLLSGRGHVFVDARYLSEDEADEIAGRLRGIQDVKTVTPIIESQAFATSQRASRGIFVRGLPGDFARELEFVKDSLVMGSAERFGEAPDGSLPKQILLASGVAESLNVIPGDDIKLISSEPQQTAFGTSTKQATFEVVGVFRTGFGDIDQIFAMVPIETAQVFFGYRGQYQNLELRIEKPEQSEKIVEQIRIVAPIVSVTDWKRLNSGIVNALAIESTMMRIVFLVLLTITSLNIITGVVMLVKNKTRDVAILRTIGASQGSILRVFLMVGGFLGLIGTLIGLSLGLLFTWNLGHIEAFMNWAFNIQVFDPMVYGITLGEIARINWMEVGFATVWTLAMSVLVTLPPALRAAKLDPVDALRFE